jgi:hypothetical protein
MLEIVNTTISLGRKAHHTSKVRRPHLSKKHYLKNKLALYSGQYDNRSHSHYTLAGITLVQDVSVVMRPSSGTSIQYASWYSIHARSGCT